ncbi:beta-ketoacyl-ACP synthase [Corallococcus sp. H22C18031201]|uniref:beta-ketoacyl-[acyl-carrier-protein] synthase family protein n=1 Tax=Citreicoccus inhibens TaxID=2849499 RepID=UPI000E756F50|nr:beta-ketoacyl synthase N-terminal-like domain-containing protein [Citreicoccus inhibens]MBU8895230.1 beta-ketoacyl-ACP synthase [Citreicoccus inhibens]RJS27362.1 beta-ketoacyl-ACP synthase [Corallococcus sp. H22C18031201]
MTRRRVVITGMGLLSPIGNGLEAVLAALRAGRSGVRAMPSWADWKDLHTRVGATVEGLDEKAIPRESRRSMGRVAMLAASAAEQALAHARVDREMLRSGRAGLSIGQTVGSPAATELFFNVLRSEGVRSLKSTTFLQLMSHSAAANLALMFKVTGRVFAPSAACASSSQAIGQGFEAIRDGYQDLMLCGGAEELHVSTAATFDILGGTSRAFNESPSCTPRPFERRRDGLVVGEGGAVLVLEEREAALRRNATIHAEVLGYSTLCDAEHMSAPAREGMARTMATCLESAGLRASDVDYVNAHATGTLLGDSVEAQATLDVMGGAIPVSSTKGFTGHTLAACGAIEAIFSVLMMREGFIAPTLNLEEVDPACQGLRHVLELESRPVRTVLSNNFAFGGVNTSLLLGLPS